MDPIVIVGACAATVALAWLYVAARRAVTIAEIEVEAGVARVVRGGIAPPVLADVRDVARRPPIQKLRIRIVRSNGRAEVQLFGSLSEEQAQRIRNVVGSVPLARLMNAPRRK